MLVVYSPHPLKMASIRFFRLRSPLLTARTICLGNGFSDSCLFLWPVARD